MSPCSSTSPSRWHSGVGGVGPTAWNKEAETSCGRVAEGYRHLAEESGARWLTVDGSAHADTVGAEVWSALNELLGGELERGR